MWELDHKKGWVPKNWCFWTMMPEKTLESPLDCKAIQPVHPKGSQSWIFIGRTDAEAEAPILWSPDGGSQLTRKDPDAGKDCRQEEKGMTEDEMVGCYHQLNRHEFERALGDGDGQGRLVWCSPWGGKESDRTELLNNKKPWNSFCYILPWKFCHLYLNTPRKLLESVLALWTNTLNLESFKTAEATDKGLISKTYKQRMQLSVKRNKQLIKKKG